MKVLIAGGGIGGITAALCLARDGHEITVFEQAESFGEVGAGIQLSPNCTRVLHWLGLEDALRASGFLPVATQIRSWDTGHVISESPLGDAAVARFGAPYYHIHRGDLLALLVAAAERATNICLRTGARVTGFEPASGKVRIATAGATDEGDLLIGADGIHSGVRAALWGNETPTFTGHVAWRAMVRVADLPEGLVRPMSTVWWGPGRHFVHYYVRRGELVNCVCVVEKTGWEVESWTERGDYEAFRADFAGWHGDVQRLIDRVDRTSLYQWALFDRPPMAAWGKGRVTLLGDACHPTLPFMAQGAAMAIEDGAVLAACLRRDEEVSVALGRYENLRRARTAKVQRGSRRNGAVFHMSGIGAWFRDRVAGKASARALHPIYGFDVLHEVLD
ncbi:MAG: monooxygenase [Gammaproteobacteria bacterium]|nr:monooxygenase [Gammaproteobacteria bacterium]